MLATIGRLEPPKGYRYLLQACSILNEKDVPFHLLVVGDGYLRKELEDLADNLKISHHVTFTGFRRDVMKILHASDICVVPSLREGFSLTLLEAMSSEKPIVATDVGGNGEAIENGISGIIVPSGNENLLAAGIRALIEDKDLSENLGLNESGRLE